MRQTTRPARLLRLAIRTVVAAVAALVALLGCAMVALQTSWGSRLLLDQLAPRLSSHIQGRLDADTLSLSPSRLLLSGLSLRDPAGNTVATVASIEVDFSLWKLLRHEVRVSSIKIAKPRLSLRLDGAGRSNLATAIASRRANRTSDKTEERTGDRSAKPSAWSFRLDQLTIENGVVSIDDQRAPTGSPWRSVELFVSDVRLSASVAGTIPRLALDLDLRAALREPFAMPVQLALASRGTLGHNLDVEAKLTAQAGGRASAIDLNVQAQLDRAGGFNPVAATTTIERLHAEPSLLRQFQEQWPLRVPIDGSGQVTWNGTSGDVGSNVKLSAGGARVSITAVGNLRTRALEDLKLAVQQVDLARLLDGAPSSNLSLDCRARASGTSLADLDGSLTVLVPRGELDGRSAGPIRLAVQAKHGHLRLTELLVSLPGATIAATGQATASPASGLGGALRGAIELKDLNALVNSVASPGREVQAQGSGRIVFVVAGNVHRPSVRLSAHLERLAWTDVAIPSLQLGLNVPDARRLLAADLTLSIPEARLGPRRLAGLSARVGGTGRRFTARLALSRPDPVTLSVAGMWTAQRRHLVLRRAQLRLARATWVLQQPAGLVSGDGRLRLTDLRLAASDGQTIRLALDKTRHGLNAAVSLSRLDLARLPQRLLALPGVAGRLTADVDLRQSHGLRRVEGRVALAGGKIGPLDAIDSTVEVHMLGDRAKANLAVKAMGAELRGEVDLPVTWPVSAASAVSANLQVSSVDLDQVSRVFAFMAGPSTPGTASQPATLKLGGTGAATLALRGTVAHPQATARLRVAALRWRDRAVGDVQVEVDLSDASTRARLSFSGEASPRGLGRLTCDLRSQAGFPTMRAALDSHRGPPAWRALATLPVQVDVQADGLDLHTLGQVVHFSGMAGGTAAMSAHFAGNLDSNQGQLALSLVGLSGRGIPPTDAKLQVTVGQREIHAHGQVSRRNASLLALNATVHSSLAPLLERSALPNTPVSVKATLGPLEWQHAGIVSNLGQPRLLRGHVGADLEVSGTLAHPRLQLAAKARDMRLDERPAGAAEALLAYQNGRLTTDLDLLSAKGGKLVVKGSLEADLSYPAVLHLPPTDKLPINATIQASQFDLVPLSGLAPVIRTVAGQLEADLQVSGTLADPRPAGRLEWKDGRLVVVGIGDYEKVHLLVHGDRDQLTMEELRADSGSGHAKLTVVATHRASGGYALRSNVNVDKFPVYAQGQALANLSLQATADSEVDRGQVRSTAKISSSHLILSDAKRKHLQSLSQPGDVILVEDGRPVDKMQEHRLAQAEAELQRRALPAQAAAPLVAPPSVVLLIDAPRGLWVNGNDANVEVGLEPGFRVEIGAETRVYGQVIVKRGHVDVLGRRFDLKENSSLRFSGPPDRPALDVTAQFVNAESNITVLATIKGSPGHLQTTLTAPDRPDLTESQLYTLIVTGHLTLAGNSSTPSTPAGQAESLLGGLLASQLQSLVSKKLPFDVLTIQTGATAGSARVEAGKYLTSDLYVGYVGRIGADPTLLQNRNAVHFEYDLGSRWSFQGEYGDAKTGSLDLYWTKRY